MSTRRRPNDLCKTVRGYNASSSFGLNAYGSQNRKQTMEVRGQGMGGRRELMWVPANIEKR